ncbi:hypothetical protein V6N13_082272 [Hibiscus sabdariffa]
MPHYAFSSSSFGTTLQRPVLVGNFGPLADPVVSAAQGTTRLPVVDLTLPSSFERPVSPVAGTDQQAAKRGKLSLLASDLDGSRNMEVDDQNLESNSGIHSVDRVASLDKDSVPPKVSYARVVAGTNSQMVVEPPPSLDDVIGSEASHPVNVRTSATESRIDSTRDENKVYGPWMIAPSRRRQPRNDTNRSKDPAIILNSSGGSRFAILEENGEKELVSPVDGVDNSCSVERSPAGVSESAVNRGGVNTARSLAGTVDVRQSSTGVTAPIQVVTSVGNQTTRVESHAVRNDSGNHSAIAILDAANESRRQSLVNVGGRLGTSRKTAGDSLKAISRLRKGKENRPPLRPLLREWLPPDLPSATTSTGQSSGVSFAAGGEVDHVIPSVMVLSRGDTLGSTELNASDH